MLRNIQAHYSRSSLLTLLMLAGSVLFSCIETAEYKQNDVGYKMLTKGCPTEYYDGIRSFEKETISHSNQIVHASISDCFSERPQLGNFAFVYPTTRRICQSNGTWSGVPPTCVNWDSFSYPANPTGLIPYKGKRIDDKSENFLHRWTRVGKSQSCCDYNTEFLSEKEKFRFIFYVEFPRNVHHNFMTFIKPSKEYSPVCIKAELYTPPEGGITDVSNISIKYLQQSYNTFAKQTQNFKGERCTLHSILAYTKRLTVVFTMIYSADSQQELARLDKLKKEWRPEPHFYPVQELNLENKQYWQGLGCPKPPEIQNAKIIGRKDDNENFVFYICEEGYILFDPKTNEKSNGSIKCYNNYEWRPYPFPVCRFVSSTLQDSFPATSQTEIWMPIVASFILFAFFVCVTAYVEKARRCRQ